MALGCDDGCRSALGLYCAIRIAAETMAAQRSGLIVNVSYWAAAQVHRQCRLWDQQGRDGQDDRPTSPPSSASSRWRRCRFNPGLVRDEEVMRNAAYFDMSNAESMEFQGRAVAALAADPRLLEKSGGVFTSADLALEYGFHRHRRQTAAAADPGNGVRAEHLQERRSERIIAA